MTSLRVPILFTNLPTKRLGRIASILTVVLSVGCVSPSFALDPSAALQHLRKAQSDAKAGKFTSATRRLEWLIHTDVDSAARTETYQRALRQLLGQKPLTFAVSGALLSSTNVSRTSSEEVFHTDIGDFTIGGGDETSGLGLRLGLTGTWRHAYALGRDVSVTAKISTSYYDDISLRSTTPTLTLSHRWLTAGARYTVSAFAADTMYPTIDGRAAPDSTAFGLSFQSNYVLSGDRAASLSATWSDRTYDERSHLDGTTASFAGTYTFPVTDTGKVTLTGGWATASLNSEHLSYSGPRVGIGYAHQSGGGLGLSVNYSKAWRDYDDIFTALSYARADDVDTISIGLSHRDVKIRGMTPRLTCSAKNQTSNVALYTYDSVDCFMSLNHAF